MWANPLGQPGRRPPLLPNEASTPHFPADAPPETDRGLNLSPPVIQLGIRALKPGLHHGTIVERALSISISPLPRSTDFFHGPQTRNELGTQNIPEFLNQLGTGRRVEFALAEINHEELQRLSYIDMHTYAGHNQHIKGSSFSRFYTGRSNGTSGFSPLLAILAVECKARRLPVGRVDTRFIDGLEY